MQRLGFLTNWGRSEFSFLLQCLTSYNKTVNCNPILRFRRPLSTWPLSSLLCWNALGFGNSVSVLCVILPLDSHLRQYQPILAQSARASATPPVVLSRFGQKQLVSQLRLAWCHVSGAHPILLNKSAQKSFRRIQYAATAASMWGAQFFH